MDRVILHSDLNNCYASIELLHRPELRNSNRAVVVGGDVEKRHGIVLAKNDIAKKRGVKTGEVIWQAMQKCPDLVSVPPNYDLYLRFSREVRNIYCRYTDQIQAFGIDENWLDVTASVCKFGDGGHIANEIRATVKRELGVTLSVGVSWNKIFAKLGSDYKKPDATTVFNRENWKDKIWPLPASDLLYVGSATSKKLRYRNILTIGDLAEADCKYLRTFLGVNGEMLWAFANGLDTSSVSYVFDDSADNYIKSIGNSCTCPRDLTTPEDVKIVFFTLAESVAARLRENGFEAQVVEIYVRDSELNGFTRQKKLERKTCLASELVNEAMILFNKNYKWNVPLRSVGIRGSDLVTREESTQMSLFVDEVGRQKTEIIEYTTDIVRARYGYFSLQRAIMLRDKKLSSVDAKSEHIIHPVMYVR